MKRTAFLQALILFLLLAGSWMLLLFRMKEDAGSPSPPQQEMLPEETAPASDLDEPDTTAAGGPETDTPIRAASPPPEWQAWWDYLAGAASPLEMRTALEILREQLFSLSREDAVERILAFLASGADMTTGLALQPGPDERLRGAATLRAILADWLSVLDPERAARLGSQLLETNGTRLASDEYVVHMRNVARVRKSEAAHNDLARWFGDLLNHDPWMESPNAAIAEAMDFAVFLEEPRVSTQVSRLLTVDQPQLLRRAASLAMERLVDANPLDTLPILLDEPALAKDAYKIRASLFARLDPAGAQARGLLDTYVLAGGRSAEELTFFLESFPNLNESRSHNLISTQISTTEPGAYIGRLERALETVERWLEDNPGNSIRLQLEETRDRIQTQLGPQP